MSDVHVNGGRAASALPGRLAPDLTAAAIWILTSLAFLAAFGGPLLSLVRDWWTDEDAAYGLLLAPLAAWLVWRTGRHPDAAPSVWLGSSILACAGLMRVIGGIAAETYTIRIAIVLAVAGLVVFHRGGRQLAAWWLPFVLLLLAVPLPAVLLGQLTLPLQLQASRLGASLLEARNVPVLLSGNVIRLPGQELFVTEACSGIRSLMALVSLATLIGGLSLRRPVSRLLLVLAAVPIAIAVNAVRIFLTGYVVHFVGRDAGMGLLHATEGWVLFIVALALLGSAARMLMSTESWRRRPLHA